MGTWGPGLYQSDDALDLRNEWNDLRRVGFDVPDITRRLVASNGSDDADSAAFWLVLADLQWRAGRLSADVRRRALGLIRDGADLHLWEDAAARRARERTLEGLARTLASRMPRPRPPRLAHPCDWKAGELILWRTIDGGTAVLRVVRFDPRWGGGGSPEVELVDVLGPGVRPEAAALARAPARPSNADFALVDGGRWRGTRFTIGVFEAGAYRASRVRRVKPLPRAPRPARAAKGKPIGISWNTLDSFLMSAFGVPWPPGTILQVTAKKTPAWLVAVDVRDVGGTPGLMCEVLSWRGDVAPSPADLRTADVRRTADTVNLIRARVVDPRNRASVAQLRRKMGVRGADEAVPFRVTLCGAYPPGSVEPMGRRRVVVPTDYANVVGWEDLDTLVPLKP